MKNFRLNSVIFWENLKQEEQLQQRSWWMRLIFESCTLSSLLFVRAEQIKTMGENLRANGVCACILPPVSTLFSMRIQESVLKSLSVRPSVCLCLCVHPEEIDRSTQFKLRLYVIWLVYASRLVIAVKRKSQPPKLSPDTCLCGLAANCRLTLALT